MTLTLSGKASKALESICDTFVPGDDGLPSASDIGVPEAIQMAVGENPSAAEREGFAGLLEAWDTQLAGTEESPFSSLGHAERERCCLRWRTGPRCRCARPSRRCARAPC